jgi:O-antigen/teichoic acid export membrane protein
MDRSRDRYRRAFATGATGVLTKAVSVLASILTVRWTFHYLGAERYGMWITITSIVMLLMFSDLGMGSGLIKVVAESMGREDPRSAQKAIASAFWILGAIAVVLSLAALAVYPFVNTGRLFNVHSALALRESGPSLLIFLMCYLVNLPLGVIFAVENGLQCAYIFNLWSVLGSVASLGALVLAIRMHEGLPWLVLALFGPPLVSTLLNGGGLFGVSHPELRPTPAAFSRQAAAQLLRIGLMFFLVQLSIAVGMQTDNIVIAQIMGAGAVSAYSVPARLFNMVNALLVMISGAVWPAYADAVARSDSRWIRKSFARVMAFGGAVTLLAVAVLVIFGDRILYLWVGPQIKASIALLAVFAVQCILYAYLQPISFLLNGLGKLRAQVVCGIAMAIVNLGLSIVFVYRYGIIGAALGTTIAMLTVQVVPLTIVVRKALRELDDKARAQDIVNASLQVERPNLVP